MKILPITTNKTKYKFQNKPGFKHEPAKVNQEKINLIKESNKEPSDLQKRLLMFSICSAIVIPAFLVFSYLNKKGNLKNIFGSKYKFQSLKDDSKIPTLETCKSINKDLKTILQKQLTLVNADKKVLEEVGQPDSANRFLLSGPPGVGKTYFSKIYAKSMDAEYMEVLFSDLNSRWVGEIEGNISSVFKTIIKQAKKNPNKKYVVTFNEIDSMLAPVEDLTGGGRGTNFASLRRQRSTFLTYLDKVQDQLSNVTIIGTTNMTSQSKNLDGATMSRFSNIKEIPYPDKECLYEALKLGLEKIKNKEQFISENEQKLKELAGQMADRKFSFRNLNQIVNEAKASYLTDKLKNNDSAFKYEYLEFAQKAIQNSDGEREIINLGKLENNLKSKK